MGKTVTLTRIHIAKAIRILVENVWEKRTLWSLFSLVFFLVGCHKSTWQVQQIDTGNWEYDCKRSVLAAKGITSSMILEKIQARGEEVYILGLCSFSLASHPPEEVVPLQIRCGTEVCSAMATLLDGGQKLLLSRPLSVWLAEKLEKNDAVFVTIGSFTAEFLAATRDIFLF